LLLSINVQIEKRRAPQEFSFGFVGSFWDSITSLGVVYLASSFSKRIFELGFELSK